MWALEVVEVDYAEGSPAGYVLGALACRTRADVLRRLDALPPYDVEDDDSNGDLAYALHIQPPNTETDEDDDEDEDLEAVDISLSTAQALLGVDDLAAVREEARRRGPST